MINISLHVIIIGIPSLKHIYPSIKCYEATHCQLSQYSKTMLAKIIPLLPQTFNFQFHHFTMK